MYTSTVSISGDVMSCPETSMKLLPGVNLSLGRKALRKLKMPFYKVMSILAVLQLIKSKYTHLVSILLMIGKYT